MSVLLGIFLYWFPILAHAEPPFTALTLKLVGGTSTSCEPSHEEKAAPGAAIRFYVCGTGAGSSILREERLASGYESFQAIGADPKDGFPIFLGIQSVLRRDQLLLAENSRQELPGAASNDSQSRRYQRISEALFLLEPSDSAGLPSNGNNTFTNLRKKLNAAAHKAKQEIEEKFTKAKSYRVELTNGKFLECQRGGNVPHPQPLTGKKIPCELSACRPTLIDGQEYEAILFHGNSADAGSPSIELVGESGLGPPLEVKATYAGSPSPQNRLLDSLPNHPTANLPSAYSAFYAFPAWKSYRQNWHDRCSSKNLDRLLALETQAYERLVRQETKQVVEYVNGIFTSSLTPETQPLTGGCHLEGNTFLAPSAAAKLEEFRGRFRHEKNSAVSEAEANNIFALVKNMADIPHAFTGSGCEARAHVIANRLQKRGLAVEKVWLTGDLFNRQNPGEMWRMHVATVIFVRNSAGSIEKKVLDPSLSPNAISVEEWVKKIGIRGRSQVETVAFPPPANAPLFQRATLSFSRVEEFLPEPFSPGENLEVTLAEAHRTNEQNLRHLKEGEAAHVP